MNTADRTRLQHMLDAGREALSFVKGRTRRDLEVNRMLVLSLVKEIEILGEAASRVSPEIREATGAIPWTQIIGMRHRLIHAYFDINLGVVWTTVESDLPPLVEKLERLLAKDI